MKGPNNKGIAGMLNSAASMLLFVMFAVCVLIIIGLAGGVYSRISSSYDETYNTAAGVKYLTNKIRSADSCEIIENGNGLALTDGGLLCVVYVRDGGVYEKNIAAGSAPTADGGEKILGLDTLEITDNGGLYSIEVAHGANSSQVLVRKG